MVEIVVLVVVVLFVQEVDRQERASLNDERQFVAVFGRKWNSTLVVEG